jgi:hypothetical protein
MCKNLLISQTNCIRGPGNGSIGPKIGINVPWGILNNNWEQFDLFLASLWDPKLQKMCF